MKSAIVLSISCVCLSLMLQAEASRRAAEQAKAQEKLQKREARKKTASTVATGQHAATPSKESSSLGGSDDGGRAEVRQQERKTEEVLQQLQGLETRAAAGRVSSRHINKQEHDRSVTVGGRDGALGKLQAEDTCSSSASAAAAPAVGGGSWVARLSATSSSSSTSGNSTSSMIRGSNTGSVAAGTPTAAARAVALVPTEAANGDMNLPKVKPPSPAAADITSAEHNTAAAGLRGSTPSENLRRPKRVECVVCLDARAEVMLLPCKHTILCQTCAELVREGGKTCPMCRTAVEGEVLVGGVVGGEGRGMGPTAAAGAHPAAAAAATGSTAAEAGSSMKTTSAAVAAGAPRLGGVPGSSLVVQMQHGKASRASSSSHCSAAAAVDATTDPTKLQDATGTVGAMPHTAIPAVEGVPLVAGHSSSSGTSSALPSALQHLLSGYSHAISSSNGLLEQEHSSQPSAVMHSPSSSSGWTPPMLQHLLSPGRLSAAVANSDLPLSRAQGEPQASRSHSGAHFVSGLQLAGTEAAAAAVLDTSAVSSCLNIHQMPLTTGSIVPPQQQQQQQQLPEMFIRDVCNLISETEAHAHAVMDQAQLQLDQGRGQLDQLQSQIEAARAQFDQMGVQLSERKNELIRMVEQHKTRLRQLCASYNVPEEVAM